MGRRRRGKSTGRADRPKEAPDYYARTDSDKDYLAGSHQRTRAKVRRQRLIRLAIFVVVAVAAYLWGPALIQKLRHKGEQTAQEVKGVGRNIRAGVDRRSGTDFDENSP